MNLKCQKANDRGQNQEAAFIFHSGECQYIGTENTACHGQGWWSELSKRVYEEIWGRGKND